MRIAWLSSAATKSARTRPSMRRSKARSRSSWPMAATVEVMPILEMYKRHLVDYDLKTVEEISAAHGAPRAPTGRGHLEDDRGRRTGRDSHRRGHQPLLPRHAAQPRSPTCRCCSPATSASTALESYTWAGNYKGALLQASPWSGPGVGSYTHEDPFNPVLDEKARITHENMRHTTRRRGSLVLGLRRENAHGRSAQRGSTQFYRQDAHAHAHEGDLVQQRQFSQPGEMDLQHHCQRAAQGRHDRRSADRMDRQRRILPMSCCPSTRGSNCRITSVARPARTRSCRSGRAASSRFTTRSTMEGLCRSRRALTAKTGDQRFADYFKFVTEGKPRSTFSACSTTRTTTRGSDGPYNVDKMIAGEYGGEPGAGLMLFRTYPRVPFWEQIHDSIPFYTDSGRLPSYLRPPRSDRVRRKPHRAPRRCRGHTLFAERDRFHKPVYSASRLRDCTRHNSIPICGRCET